MIGSVCAVKLVSTERESTGESGERRQPVAGVEDLHTALHAAEDDLVSGEVEAGARDAHLQAALALCADGLERLQLVERLLPVQIPNAAGSVQRRRHRFVRIGGVPAGSVHRVCVAGSPGVVQHIRIPLDEHAGLVAVLVEHDRLRVRRGGDEPVSRGTIVQAEDGLAFRDRELTIHQPRGRIPH